MDVFWIERATKQRVSVEELLSSPVTKTFLPCRSETACGYDERIEIIVPYFALATQLDIEREYNFRLVNPPGMTCKSCS